MSSGVFGDREKAESQSELMRQYLEEHGVPDVLTRILADVYSMKEKPKDICAYIIERMSGVRPGKLRVTVAENALADYRNKTLSMAHEIADLKKKNAQLESDLESTVKELADTRAKLEEVSGQE